MNINPNHIFGRDLSYETRRLHEEWSKPVTVSFGEGMTCEVYDPALKPDPWDSSTMKDYKMRMIFLAELPKHADEPFLNEDGTVNPWKAAYDRERTLRGWRADG